MYRYNQPSRGGRSRNFQTILQLITLLLFIATVSLGFAYFRTARINANTHTVLVARLQNEVSQAKTSSDQLTGTGGSKISSLIATVRQHVYAARVLNEMSTGIYGPGNVLVQDALINDCITVLNSCDRGVQTGSVLTGVFAELRVAITKLYDDSALLQ